MLQLKKKIFNKEGSLKQQEAKEKSQHDVYKQYSMIY